MVVRCHTPEGTVYHTVHTSGGGVPQGPVPHQRSCLTHTHMRVPAICGPEVRCTIVLLSPSMTRDTSPPVAAPHYVLTCVCVCVYPFVSVFMCTEVYILTCTYLCINILAVSTPEKVVDYNNFTWNSLKNCMLKMKLKDVIPFSEEGHNSLETIKSL